MLNADSTRIEHFLWYNTLEYKFCTRCSHKFPLRCAQADWRQKIGWGSLTRPLMMDSISFNKWIRNISIHMKMNTVSTNNFGLTTMSKFCISNMWNHSIFRTSCHQKMGAILIFCRSFITHHFYISSQKSNFCSYLKTIITICLNSWIMFM